ncbi:autotransporter domain-containing protein [Roseobacter sp. HKCCA0434]|uniref:autotransporter domain-containing protein n=1 Tax=Roseobacter sp. HKCCA0434 TaxID=3079297 RepID=UPI0029059C23|nr:autotransporter domain-containing protein [Roseobacter sp. HKCCA0434]
MTRDIANRPHRRGALALLLASTAAMPAFAEDFVVDFPTAQTNGGFVVDGDDTISLVAPGAIETVGDSQHGIATTGDGNAILADSTLNTSGLTANAIDVDGDSTSIEVLSALTTQGSGSDGIFVRGSDAEIIVNALVQTTGTGGEGISVLGATAYVEIQSGGEVITVDNDAAAIRMFGVDNTLVMEGTALTQGAFADAIQTSGSNAAISVGGSVETAGQGAIGIDAGSDNAEISLSGTILTNGTDARGIRVRGDNGLVTLSGGASITANGADANGLEIDGQAAVVDMQAASAILIGGTNAYAVRLDGDDGLLTIGGEIGNTAGSGGTATFGDGNRTVVLDSAQILLDSGLGVRATGNGSEIENNGTIATSDVGGHGILTSGSDMIVRNDGSVSTSGLFGEAVRMLNGTDVRFENSGQLSTSGESANAVRTSVSGSELLLGGVTWTTGTESHGVYVATGDVAVEVTGSIATAGIEAGGVVLDGAGNSVTTAEGSEITAMGDASDGIDATGADTRLSINGDVSAMGIGGDAVSLTGDDADMTLGATGVLAASGIGGSGITVTGADATIRLESGAQILGFADAVAGIFTDFSGGTVVEIAEGAMIETNGNSGGAVLVNGADSLVSNAGLVTTVGDGASGIAVENDSEIRNSGAIATSGAGSSAVILGFMGGERSVLDNSGSIGSVGDNTVVVNGLGSGSTLRNSGAIIAAGAVNQVAVRMGLAGTQDVLVENTGTIIAGPGNDFAVVLLGDTGRVVNEGNITGSFADAVFTNGVGHDVRNAGRIYSDQVAVRMTGADARLRLDAGSTLVGEVIFDDPATAILDIGLGNAAYEVTGIPDTVLTDGRPSLIDGNTVVVVDPAGFAAASDATFDSFADLGDLVMGMRTDFPEREAQPAVASFAPLSFGAQGIRSALLGHGGRDSGRQVWGTFGFERGEDTDSDDFTLGVALPVGGGRLDLFAARATSDFDGGATGSALEADATLVGAAWGGSWSAFDWDAALIVGQTDGESTRIVADNTLPSGFSTATGEVSGQFAGLSLRLGTEFERVGRVFEPSLQVSYVAARTDGYIETGASAPLVVSDRQSGRLSARAELATRLAPIDTVAGRLDLRLHGGLGAELTHGDDVRIASGAAATAFDDGTNGTDFGAFVGAGARLRTAIGDLHLAGELDTTGGDADLRITTGFSVRF